MELTLLEHGYTKSLEATPELEKLRNYFFILEKLKAQGGKDDTNTDSFKGSNL